MKILVIEDERDIAELIAHNLEREGFQVETAMSGEEGLSKAKIEPPGLVVLDIMLPEMNGLDVCRSLRSDGTTRGIPIIMLTARDEDIDVVTGLEVGADDYLTKPFSPRVLIARIRSVLRRYKESAESNNTNSWRNDEGYAKELAHCCSGNSADRYVGRIKHSGF